MSFFKIKGVIPPMITPFDENDEVDFDKHINNVKKWGKKDIAGYLVLGSNSETVYLTEDEKLKLIELTIKNKQEDKFVMVGTGMEATKETIYLTNRAADLGADCALIVTPHYYAGKMDDQALIEYYSDVADNTKIPILIYNVTKYTHVNVSPKALSVLSKHPNIIGMKDSSGNIPQLISYKSVVDMSSFNLMVGTAGVWNPALALGVEGAVLALVNCCPQECIDIQKEHDTGNIDKSREIYERVFPVNAAVTGKYGIAGLKYACDLLGFEGGLVRKPLLQLSKQERVEIREILTNAKVL